MPPPACAARMKRSTASLSRPAAPANRSTPYSTSRSMPPASRAGKSYHVYLSQLPRGSRAMVGRRRPVRSRPLPATFSARGIAPCCCEKPCRWTPTPAAGASSEISFHRRNKSGCVPACDRSTGVAPRKASPGERVSPDRVSFSSAIFRPCIASARHRQPAPRAHVHFNARLGQQSSAANQQRDLAYGLRSLESWSPVGILSAKYSNFMILQKRVLGSDSERPVRRLPLSSPAVVNTCRTRGECPSQQGRLLHGSACLPKRDRAPDRSPFDVVVRLTVR